MSHRRPCASAVFLPQDGHLDPSQLTFALADGARSGSVREICYPHPRHGHPPVGPGASWPWRPTPARSRPRSSWRPAASTRPTSARLVDVAVPIIPFGHQYLVTEPFDPPLGPFRRCATPTTSSTSAPRWAAWCRAATSATPFPGRSTACPRGSRRRLLTEDPDRFEELLDQRHPPRAGNGDRAGQALLQRPRGLHARRRVLPRRVARARLLGRRRVLRPRPGGRRRRRQGDGRVDRRRPARVRRLAHGPQALRPALREPGLHPRPHLRGAVEVLRHQVPRRRALEPRGPCGSRPPTPGSSSSAQAFGEKAGWERANWFESNAARGDEALRPTGWAGRNWSPAIGAEARATREARRHLRPVELRQARGRRARRHGVPRPAGPPTPSTGPSAPSSTRSCSTRAAASSATSP